jgi:cob(I)alamin adenosyltransferase
MVPEVTKEATGLVIVNTGEGKGKTTAALGLLLRAWGWEMKVVMFQFIKSSRSDRGEHKAAQRMGVEIIRADQKGKYQAIKLWDAAKERIISGSHDIVILDELSYPLRYGWLSVEEVLDVLRHRPNGTHVVITGRNVPEECINFADLVTEMRQVKHPLGKGIRAQPGIEF